MKILLKSAKIIDSNSSFHKQTKDVLIENGIISKISNTITPSKNCKIIDYKDLHISTGWFDSSVSFGEPGFEERETIKNGLEVAARSGFTSVAINSNTNPVLDTKSSVDFLIQKSKNTLVKIYPIASLTKQSEGLELAELFDMQNTGAIAFNDYKKSTLNTNLLKIALQYAQNFDALICSFPLDQNLANGYVNEGVNSTKFGLKGIPALAEELQISRDLTLLEYTGGKLHIPCISTKKSVELIANAKKKGLDVSCSVAIHNLVLTDDLLHLFDANFKITPPLRTKKDCDALIKGLKKGIIDMVTSDHNPIDIENKKVPFERAKYGTIGLESAFGLLHKVVDLETAIQSLTNTAKKRFGIEITSINVGEKANITLFNPNVEYLFSEKHIYSKSKNSIALNQKLKGIVYGVINEKLNHFFE